MPRNIVIFSDGTGQRGGLFFDERRSNIYKLYRATRCGPDSSIDPADQLTFYDPGIGTVPAGGNMLGTLWRRFYNLVSQALGLGLTGNIIDCYAAIAKLWQPGDRIFLFGFSRGAYTIRCLGATIALCGVPTTNHDGGPLRRDMATSKRIAKEAVKRVYLHTNSRKYEGATAKQKQWLDQRLELARRFRARHGSGDPEGPNEYPYFIGVFDTVASLANPVAIVILTVLAALAVIPSGLLLWYLLPSPWHLTVWWAWPLVLTALTALIAISSSLWMRVKIEVGLTPRPWWRLFHFAEARMKFYDTGLNKNVGYARHALSIDEGRTSFERVKWGEPGEWRDTGRGNPRWFEQLWFAGNHSDIGGSYPEDKSRLSDITLKWMRDAAMRVGLNIDPSVLRLHPDPTGPLHDETRSGIFRYAGHGPRQIGHKFPLHESVIRRFEAQSVLQYNSVCEYRPENLRDHDQLKRFYAAAGEDP